MRKRFELVLIAWVLGFMVYGLVFCLLAGRSPGGIVQLVIAFELLPVVLAYLLASVQFGCYILQLFQVHFFHTIYGFKSGFCSWDWLTRIVF